MRGSPVFMPNLIQIFLYITEKILENRQKRPNLGTQPVKHFRRNLVLHVLPLNASSVRNGNKIRKKKELAVYFDRNNVHLK